MYIVIRSDKNVKQILIIMCDILSTLEHIFHAFRRVTHIKGDP